MKIHLESGDRIEVIVPSRLDTRAAIAVEDDEGQAMLDVGIVDGFLNTVDERSVRRHATRVEDRLKLWGHLVSAHAAILVLDLTLEELIEAHEHEHNGPGTIRNHPRESREYSLQRIAKVLSEATDERPVYQNIEGCSLDDHRVKP